MCLIAIAPKGTNKYSDLFLNGIRESAKLNKDGFGFAYKRKNGTFMYAKGYMNIEVMLETLVNIKLQDEDELVIHLRMRSAGVVSPANTHPFEIPVKTQTIFGEHPVLRQASNPLLFHNGTFSDFTGKDEHSDTYHFANSFMSITGIWDMLLMNKAKFLESFSNIIRSNKLVIMDRDMETVKIGDFIEKEGYIFSNNSFESYEIRFPHAAKKTSNDYRPGKQSELLSGGRLPVIREENIGLKTKDIKINSFNFKDFMIKAHCQVPKYAINADEKYIIKALCEDGQYLLSRVGTAAHFKYLEPELIDHCFIKLPMDSTKHKYFDLMKLIRDIKPTKSQIKKMYAKINSYSNRKKVLDCESMVTLKHDGAYVKYNYQAVLLFLMDHVAPSELRIIHELYHSTVPKTKEYVN